MSVDTIVEIHERSGTYGVNNEHEYVRRFKAVTSEPSVTAKEVLDAVGPAMGAVYNIAYGDPATSVVDVDSRLQRKTADNFDENPQAWMVTCEYGREGSPLSEPAEVRWGLVQFQRPLERTRDTPTALAITNVVGDPFDPPPEIDDSRMELSVSYWSLAFTPHTAEQYKDAVNSDIVTLAGHPWAAETIKVANLGATRQLVNGVYYWKWSWVLHFNSEGWRVKALNRGYRYKDPVDSKVKPVLDFWGQQVATPVMLKADGGKAVPFVDAANFVQFRAYREVAMGGLGWIYA